MEQKAIYLRCFEEQQIFAKNFKILEMDTIEITDSNFNEVLNTDKPVLVDFWAEWCGPCKMIGPVVKELASEYDGRAVIGKVNVDENPGTAAQFGIRSIPTLLVFKDGQVVDKQIGAVPKAVLAGKLDAQLN